MANYESEAKLEDRMIDQLRKQGYNYVEINDVEQLEANFRKQINIHNKAELKGKDLSDKEFEKLMIKISGKSIFQSAKELRQKQDIIRDDGTVAYIELFNTKEWCKNLFQVTHQTTVEGKYTNRYDVTILINGLPLVQIELKRRGIDMKEAYDQIKRYKNHSYNGLYRFIQLFVILVYPLLKLYNGKVGKNKWMKWFFYIYYPLHLIVIGILRIIIYGNISLLF